MVKVEAVIDFLDLAENVNRHAGERFDVSEERAKELSATEYGTLVTVIEEVKPKRRSAKAE